VSSVAVIGGTGFLGRHVVSALRGAGEEVRVLSRRSGCDATRLEPGALRGCDAVVNLAGIKRERGGQTFQAVHVDLVARLIDAMKAAGVRRLVHVSVLVARADPEHPYHDTKWRGEELVRASGLDWTILRPGVIYGVGDDLLSHLALMIHTAPVFPIVNDGGAPMMPVHAGDVAAGVVGALRRPASAGKTYDVVGPERLTLRGVVGRVAEALGRPLLILPTPAALLTLPVALMEKTMAQPLSTRAQLAMLVEGLAGDPDAARRDLGVEPAPFTPERLRPLLDASGVVLRKEIAAPAALGLYGLAAALVGLAFRGPFGPWKGMTVAMGVLLALSLAVAAVRRRLAPSVSRVGLGLAAGGVLYGLTRLAVWGFARVWPEWEGYARQLSAWKTGFSTPFLAATLLMIVLAEETLWRGVVTRFAVERLGRAAGIVVGAALYAAAHAVTLNPLLLAAAFCCGVFWGLLYAATDDLTAPVVSHLAWDVVILFLAPVV
jgi:NADH dehydrogenase